MKTISLIVWFAIAYATYYYSQRYKANPYLWMIIGCIFSPIGLLIAWLHFKNKPILDKKPNPTPLGFRSRTRWKMVVASLCYLLIFTFIAIASSATAKSNAKMNENTANAASSEEKISAAQTSKSEEKSETAPVSEKVGQTINGKLKVHYIDVGQADSILVQQGSQSMLIDAGNNADANTVVTYLKQQGVSKIDYLIMTHPHEDHIGGADAVINTFNIRTVYMPKVTSTTQTFKDVVTAMNNKSLKATVPIPGSTFKLGDAVCTILAPK